MTRPKSKRTVVNDRIAEIEMLDLAITDLVNLIMKTDHRTNIKLMALALVRVMYNMFTEETITAEECNQLLSECYRQCEPFDKGK